MRVAYHILRLLWVAACLLVVGIWFHSRATQPNATGADELLGYMMIALSFPIGIAAIVAQGWVAYLLTFQLIREGNLQTFAFWGELFVLGYVQWFVLLPRLVRFVTRRLAGRTAEDH